MSPPGLAHVNTVSRDRLTVLLIGLIMAMIAFLLRSAAQNDFTADWGAGVFVPRAVGYLAASLFVAAAGFISAGFVIHGRAQARAAAATPAATSLDQTDESEAAADAEGAPRAVSRRSRFRPGPEWLAGWPQVAASILFGTIALAAVVVTWQSDDLGALRPQMQQVFGGLLILLAFPFLVLERVYANTAPQTLPDASQLERLLRVPLVAFLGFGITSVLTSFGFEWPSLVERALAVVIGLVALELILRGLAMVFIPVAPIEERRSVADSTVASLLRLTPPTLSSVRIGIRRQFGIDLSRSWALAFVRRAALPISLGMVVFAWCMTGVTALGLSQRAVYERFGAPVAIFGPGLHIHLPWPLGVLRPVELGVVHEIPIVFNPEGAPGDQAASTTPAARDSAEAIPPASADRLWDASHPGEASYLIASETQGKQSFQIVNIDLRVVYRVGLSDEAARQAAYAVADPEALIRAAAGELLVRYFARYTLLDVLGQSRERIANDFRTELQAELQRLSTGIDVIAVIVEAIHPPPAAAAAYHNVQAAEILAQSQIALRQADAISEMKSADQDATDDRNNALASAAERVDQAQAETVLFQGDRQAYHQDGKAFLLERWFTHLSNALAKASFMVIDSRLKGATAPTIDLRSFDLPGAAAPVNNPPSSDTSSSQGSQGSSSPPEQEGSGE